ncbi:MAG: hypothetical protein JNL72_07175 [Flavipsychrobacter sp.]|nr:hypothetical protein [Flavipsychrobacter sp.]
MQAQKIKRYVLASVLGIVALNALGGGYYGMSGAKGIPLSWLDGSPFHSYFIPALVLFVGVGGSCAVSFVAVLRGASFARMAALLSGLLLLGWILVQVSIIGYVSWLQPAMIVAAIVILALVWHLPGLPGRYNKKQGP